MRRVRALALTHPGGPIGWPLQSGMSCADACDLLGARRGPVYVVAIDQARISGWAVHDTRRVVAHGVAHDTPSAQDALDRMERLDGFGWARVLVCFEDHRAIKPARRRDDRGQPKHNPTATAIGLGDARGGWRVLLDLRGHPAAQRIHAPPSVWREVIGRRGPGDRDDWKERALNWAKRTLTEPVADDNAAEAAGMAVWAASKGLHGWALARARRIRAAQQIRAARRGAP